MAHRCILGTLNGPLVLFDKELGKVTVYVCTKYVLLDVYKHTRMIKKETFLRQLL
jgi:hypothetical protein